MLSYSQLESIDMKYSPPIDRTFITGTLIGLLPKVETTEEIEAPPANWLIYDCEIINAICNPKQQPLSGIRYCKGWTDFEGMGVAVIGYKINHEPVQYCLSVTEFGKIVEAFPGVVVGFNSISFDDPLLLAHGLPIRTGYDLLCEIRSQVGLARNGKAKKGQSYKLDKIAQYNEIGGKSMDGALAPVEWQRGNRKQVIDYCKQDVEITYQILMLGLTGKLKDPNTGDLIILPPLFPHDASIKENQPATEFAEPVESDSMFVGLEPAEESEEEFSPPQEDEWPF